MNVLSQYFSQSDVSQALLLLFLLARESLTPAKGFKNVSTLRLGPSSGYNEMTTVNDNLSTEMRSYRSLHAAVGDSRVNYYYYYYY